DVEVRFINDGWDGQLGEGHDRNLYISSLIIDGETIDGTQLVRNTASNGYDSWDPHAAVMVTNGSAFYSATAPSESPSAPPPSTGTATPPPTGSTSGAASSGGTSDTGTLTLHVSGDHYAGDPQFQVFVDGQQIGGTQSVQAVHANGQWQDVTLTGNFDPNADHQIAVKFINDGWDGKLGEGNDRNLYVGGGTIGDHAIAGNSAPSNTAEWGQDSWDPHAAVMVTNGTVTFNPHANALLIHP